MCLSTEKYYLIWHNYQAAKNTQDLTKLPKLFLCRGNARKCLWQQTARDSKTGKQGLHYINCPESQKAFYVSKGNISVLGVFFTAEEKRVLPSGSHHFSQTCHESVEWTLHGHFSCLFPSGGRGGLSWLSHYGYSYSVVPTLLRSLEPKLHVIISCANKVIHMTQPWQ